MNNTPQNDKKKVNVGKNKQMGLIITVLVLVLLVVVVIIAMILGGNSNEKDPDVTKPPKQTDAPIGPGGTTPGDKEQISVPSANLFIGTLLNINANNKKGGTPDFEEGVAINEITKEDLETIGYVRLNQGDGYSLKVKDWTVVLKKEAADALNEMLEAFKAVSNVEKNNFVVISGYSKDTTSSYSSGYCAFLNTSEYTGFESSSNKVTIDGKEMKWSDWFKANCAKFGFIYVGVGEFRYVGKVHAAYMTQNSLGVEEYIQAVKNAQGGVTVTDADGATWTVSYYKANKSGSTLVNAGAGKEYVISGDNASGFIVACKN